MFVHILMTSSMFARPSNMLKNVFLVSEHASRSLEHVCKHFFANKIFLSLFQLLISFKSLLYRSTQYLKHEPKDKNPARVISITHMLTKKCEHFIFSKFNVCSLLNILSSQMNEHRQKKSNN